MSDSSVEVAEVSVEPPASGVAAVTQGGTAPKSEVSFVEMVNLLLRHRRLVFGTPVVLGLVIGILTMLGPRTYSAVGSFMPQSSEMPRSAPGLAQLGLASVLLGGNSNAGFYSDLLRTQEIRFATAETVYEFEWQGEQYKGSLTELLEIDHSNPLRRRESILRAFDKLVTIEVAPSNIITVTVTTPYAPLSEQVASRMLELVGRFDRERRRSQAGMERRFAEERVAEARAELQRIQDEVSDFLERNRDFANSPRLSVEYARLQELAAQHQQVYLSLYELYERARIEEVRNTPVITIVDDPTGFARPDPKGTVRKAIVGVLVGGVLGVFSAILIEFLGSARTSDRKDVRELIELTGRLHRRWVSLGRRFARR